MSSNELVDVFQIGPEKRNEIIRSLRQAGVNGPTLSDVFGISRERVYQIGGRGKSEIDRQEAVRLFCETDMTVSAIAQSVNHGFGAVFEWLQQDVGSDAYKDRCLKRNYNVARKYVEEFTREVPDVPITYRNLERYFQQRTIAVQIDRVKSMRAWRIEFGQPEILNGKVSTTDEFYTKFVGVVK